MTSNDTTPPTTAPAEPTTAPAALTLRFPFRTAAGAPVSVLTPRRLKVRDMKQAQRDAKTASEVELAAIALACGLTPEDLDDMDMADYEDLQDRFRQMRVPSAG
ncbi:phage tail assembly protein [Lysobacter sp. CA196]|uniref:phage tail assembly protein n=1 Tax=Lysobacter sp. CA196 TaxID=3455606 RepID=UPI003F8D29F1